MAIRVYRPEWVDWPTDVVAVLISFAAGVVVFSGGFVLRLFRTPSIIHEEDQNQLALQTPISGVSIVATDTVEKDWDHTLLTVLVKSSESMSGCKAKLLSLRDEDNREFATGINSLMTIEHWTAMRGDKVTHSDSFDLLINAPETVVLADVDSLAQPVQLNIQYTAPSLRGRGILVGTARKFWIDIGIYSPKFEPKIETFLYGFDGHAALFWSLKTRVLPAEAIAQKNDSFYKIAERYRGHEVGLTDREKKFLEVYKKV